MLTLDQLIEYLQKLEDRDRNGVEYTYKIWSTGEVTIKYSTRRGSVVWRIFTNTAELEEWIKRNTE